MKPLSTLLRCSLSAVALFALLPASAQTTLRFSSFFPSTHAYKLEVFEPWAAEVGKATQGRVKVEILPKMVGTLAGQADAVRDGLADISVLVNGYTPGRFPLSEVGELPFLSTDAERMSPAYYRLYKAHLEKHGEFKRFHVLTTFTVASGHVFMAKKQLRNISDFKGQKLRSPGGTTLAISSALGVVPVQKSVTEAYELVANGIVDGTYSNRETVYGYKLLDVLPHLTVFPGGLFNSVLTVVMNKDKWESISKEDQQAIMRISGEALAASYGKLTNRLDAHAVEELRKAGGTVKDASPQLVLDLKQRLSQVEQAWIAKARKAGMADADKVLAEFRATLNADSTPAQAKK
jgi:TRAP-type C4-dicarboxylate transport system substrate-binding protein